MQAFFIHTYSGEDDPTAGGDTAPVSTRGAAEPEAATGSAAAAPEPDGAAAADPTATADIDARAGITAARRPGGGVWGWPAADMEQHAAGRGHGADGPGRVWRTGLQPPPVAPKGGRKGGRGGAGRGEVGKGGARGLQCLCLSSTLTPEVGLVSKNQF